MGFIKYVIGDNTVLHLEKEDKEKVKYLLLDYKDNILHFNGINLEELLKKYKTPIFLFSQEILEMQYDRINEIFSSLNIDSLKIAFSVKSNPVPRVAQTFAKKGSYFEATSLGEVKHVLANGGVPNHIIFTNIVKTVSAIKFSLEHGVGLFAVDSWSDMLNIERVCKSLQLKSNVLLRVNPGTLLDDTLFSCTGINSKIGILNSNNLDNDSLLRSILDYCLNSKWLSFRGLHVHLGSQIINLDQYREGMRRISQLISQIENLGTKVKILDIGGGFPVNYGGKEIPPVEKFRDVIQEVFNGQLSSLELILESGRYLTAPASILVFQIAIIKEINPFLNIACVNGSFYNTIPDVIIADWFFPIKNVKHNKNSPIKPYRIVGSSNDTLDLYHGQNKKDNTVLLPKLEEGDNIAFLQVGAYSISFNSTYCMEERPLVHFIDNSSQ